MPECSECGELLEVVPDEEGLPLCPMCDDDRPDAAPPKPKHECSLCRDDAASPKEVMPDECLDTVIDGAALAVPPEDAPVAVEVLAQAIHQEWRGGMLRQRRHVSDERMEWGRLPAQDKRLDRYIASKLLERFSLYAHPEDAQGETDG